MITSGGSGLIVNYDIIRPRAALGVVALRRLLYYFHFDDTPIALARSEVRVQDFIWTELPAGIGGPFLHIFHISCHWWRVVSLLQLRSQRLAWVAWSGGFYVWRDIRGNREPLFLPVFIDVVLVSRDEKRRGKPVLHIDRPLVI